MTESDVLKFCEKIADEWEEYVEIQVGDENGKYINLLVESNDPQATLKRIKGSFIESKTSGREFSNAMILTATSDNGWDDYLLLHHYDGDQESEAFPEIAE